MTERSVISDTSPQIREENLTRPRSPGILSVGPGVTRARAITLPRGPRRAPAARQVFLTPEKIMFRVRFSSRPKNYVSSQVFLTDL